MSDGSAAPRPVSTSRRITEAFDTFIGGPARTRPRPRTTPPLVELRNVDAGYGPFRALFGVSFRVWPGQATALLGSNGAGKTTVARVCSGLIEPTEGQLLFDGMDATGFAAWELARMGITHVAEGRSVFGTLSVEENLELAFRQMVDPKELPDAFDAAYEMFPILRERRKQVAGTLSGGQQRMLSLARAFPRPPRLLIADELSLGLAPLIVDEVFEALVKLREQGSSLLIIEQHVERALEICEHTVIIQKGQVVYDGRTEDVGDIVEQVLPNVER